MNHNLLSFMSMTFSIGWDVSLLPATKKKKNQQRKNQKKTKSYPLSNHSPRKKRNNKKRNNIIKVWCSRLSIKYLPIKKSFLKKMKKLKNLKIKKIVHHKVLRNKPNLMISKRCWHQLKKKFR